MDVGFVLICAALVFLMQAGFCMLESGMVRAKNSINVAVKNLLDFAVSTLVFAAFGFSLMFGMTESGLFGSHVEFWISNELGAFFLFQMVFCGTAATIVSGAVAERTPLFVYLFIVSVLTGFTYPLIGHWCWGGALQNTGSGWLAGLGFVDWAGTAVVHITGGFGSLAAILAIGPRRNYRRGKLTGGHSLTLAIMGCFLLWVGWWGFNGGSGLSAEGNVALVVLNTNLGAIAGLIAAAAGSWLRTRQTNVVDLISGTLAGLVSVTGACHAISPIAAIVAGAIGSVLALWANDALRKRGADDAVGAFGVHGAAGVWGTLVFGLFAPTTVFSSGSRVMQLSVQSLGGLVACFFSFFTVYGSLKLLAKFTRLRVRAGEEHSGLNVTEHGATNEVADLLGAMNHHRQSGDFSVRLETDTGSEVGQIASEYNAVISRVNDEVAQHQSTNRALQGEKLRLQSVLEHAGVGIFQLDDRGRFQSANTTLLEIFGYPSASTLIERSDGFSIPWHDENGSDFDVVADHFRSGREIKDLETQFTDATGVNRWLLESIVPVRDENGCLIAWLGTVHDVTERKQAMLAEVQIAEAKSAAKGEFLANMSHEIRTPLNGVIGMLDLLSTGELELKQKNYVNVARSSADSLLGVINDILDFSKIEAGKLELEHVDFDLRELMESTVEQFALLAHSKGLEMNCNLDVELPYMVAGDPERLRQSITNLMGNAVKFTDKGEVNLSASRRDGVIHFSVEDSGIGISAAAQSTLFESFAQADVSTTRKYGGTGLGLTIVSKLVQLMGGKLNVDSVVGQGATFWFELPLVVVNDEMPSAENAEEVLARLAHCNVLIVDDNDTNCEILQNQFANWGMASSVCKQSTAVVQKMLVAERVERPVDLIVLDYCMPEKDGPDVARELRKHPTLNVVPIIMLSSNHDLLSQQELKDVGIDIALTKPARQSRLFDSIVSVLDQGRPQLTVAVEQQESSATQSPKEIVAPPAAQTRPPELTESVASTPADALSVPTESNSNPEPAKQVSARVDVLVAEDNEINQLVVQQMLAMLGYSVEVAENGEVALQRVQTGSYGMILMDGHMPVMDGQTATRRIREWEAECSEAGTTVRRLPIVALTADVVSGIRDECLAAGMDDYMCKPITLDGLQDATLRYIGEPTPPEAVCSDSTSANGAESRTTAMAN
ncbi:UNVERIFIED_CONTAM: hypothetical protein GTU68_044008 [Idotea baltica]|nr:hypothetical protein [Idotea baltica]